jgi:hypothetical protein
LTKQLDLEVSTDGSVSDIVFNLLNWAETNDCIFELVQAAYRGNPNKSELIKVAQELGIC